MTGNLAEFESFSVKKWYYKFAVASGSLVVNSFVCKASQQCEANWSSLSEVGATRFTQDSIVHIFLQY